MSELDLYAKYLDLGVKLGRTGEDLATWVEDKVRQDMERCHRQIERERKREEMEMQREEREMQKHGEEKEMEMQKHREEMAFRMEEKEREMQKEESQRQLELRRMELEAETKKLEIGSRVSADVAGPKLSYGAQRPKIPPLHDLFQPQEAEDFGTFINRARRYFDRWVELSGVSTLECLSYLVCSEIALQACDEDFVAYVKDRSPSDMVALKTDASAYMDARPNKSFRRKHSVSFAAKSEPYRSTCGGKGHVRPECPSRPREANSASLVPELPSHCCAAKMDCNPIGGLKIESCKVFDRVSTLLRDSGCNTNKLFPTCIINIKTPYFSGDVEACLLDSPIADVILGNISGWSSESPPFDSNSFDVFPNSSIACVVTRAQASKASFDNDLPISTNSTHFNVLDPFSDLPVRQREDPSLKPWFQRVGLPPVAGVSFRIEDGILERLPTKSKCSSVQTTVAVPKSLRQVVLSYAHESDLSGHSGFRKTLSAIRDYFSWPGVCSDVKNYITSCHLCQIKPRTGRDQPAPFQQVPIVGEPFERVVIDLVGPLPVSCDKYEYLLTLVDVSTRWAEAVPQRKITAKDVAGALFSIFTRLGFPKEIQSDRGQQFMSNLLAEFNSLCDIKHFVSTPYHPQTNGIVERFHSTLKSIIRKLSHESPSEWSCFVPAALFAYRGQVHSSTGFSPFYLLFGRVPRGPMQILSDVFLNKNLSRDTSFQYQYVINLHNRIRKDWQIAQESMRDSASESRLRHEPKSRLKHFIPGNEVLVLLSTSDNKLVLSYKGPYTVVEKRTGVVYLVDLGDRRCTFHVNLLRNYKRSTCPPPPSDDLGGVDGSCSGQAFAGATSLCDQFEFPFSSLSTIEPSLSINNVLDGKLDPIHDSSLKFCDTICFAEPTAYVVSHLRKRWW
ncbi:gypsy retrotransposon integrase-like protein 1 [Plakobranchus ocellatus]|uniref:Gypsy retrotransposon integrase-like protein 1 n=1 Tax=Plakobranchus ocellatus TaxID=259542 RepID=A0AAV4C8N1_9GAST|nr:gypsy retrotransposon integrase-like protein 1 [Plakobranchus ocellatus]